MDESGNCTCCPCDATVTRQFDQTSGRFNDRSAFASANAMDTVTQLNSMFTAQAQQTLQKNSSDQLALAILSQRSVVGQPG